jgi:tetratricopeptide (TPR) repeat protein
MPVIISTVVLAVFLAIAPLNKFLFKIENQDEIKRIGRDRLRVVETLLNQQKYAEARDSLQNIVSYFESKKDPSSNFIVQYAMYQIGMSYRSDFAYEESIRAFHELVAKFPNTSFAEYAFNLNGQSSMELEKWKVAIEEYEKIEKNRPIARYFPKYRNIDLETNKYVDVDKASSSVNKSEGIKIYTKDMQHREATGEDKKEESAELLSDVIINIGQCYIHLNETEKARQEFDLIRTFFPGSDRIDNAQKLIADTYKKDGEIAGLQAEKVSDPQEKQKLSSKSNTYYERAIGSYQKFVNVYAKSELLSDAYIDLGDIFYMQGKNKEADNAFFRAISTIKEPEMQAKIQLKIGKYFEDQKRWKQAVESYAKVLQNYSQSAVADNAVYLTGICYEQMNDTAKAIEFFSNICEYYKNSQFYAPSALKLGQKYEKLGDYKKALQYYRSGIALSPTGPVAPQTQFQIGSLFKDRGEYQAALDEFNEVVNNYEGEWNSKALFQMVDCYKRMGEMDKAKETALKIKDNTELVIESYKLLGIGASTPEEELALWKDKADNAVEDKAKVAALMEVANIQLYKLNLPDDAYANFKKILEISDDEIRKINADVGIGQIYMMQGKFQEARDVYKSILENPKTALQVKTQIEYKIDDTYRREGAYDKAIEGFRVFVEENKASDLAAYAQFSLGVCYSEKKEFDKALLEYQKVLDEYKGSDVFGQTVLAIGSTYKEQQKFDVAIDYWLGMLKENPGLDVSPQIYFHIGVIYKENKEDYAKTVYYLDKIVNDYPDFPMYSTSAYLLGESHVKLNQNEKAINAYSKVKPEDKDVRRAADAEMGKLLVTKDPAGAVASFERIIASAENDQDRAIAEIGKGDIYIDLKKFGQAAESFHKAYSEYKGASDTLRGGSLIKEIDAYSNLGESDKVIKLSDQMVKEFPDNPYMINAVYFKANAYYSRKNPNYSMAREVFQQIIKLNKSEQMTEIAFYQKADCLLFMQKYETAIGEYKEYLKRYKDGKYVGMSLYQIGNCYWAQEDFTKAKDYYEKVVTTHPDFSEICSAKGFLGYCLDQLKQWKRARVYYKEVLNSRACEGEARKFAKDQLDANLVAH